MLNILFISNWEFVLEITYLLFFLSKILNLDTDVPNKLNISNFEWLQVIKDVEVAKSMFSL